MFLSCFPVKIQSRDYRHVYMYKIILCDHLKLEQNQATKKNCTSFHSDIMDIRFIVM